MFWESRGRIRIMCNTFWEMLGWVVINIPSNSTIVTFNTWLTFYNYLFQWVTDISTRAKSCFPLASDVISESFSNGAVGSHDQMVRAGTWAETYLPCLCLNIIFLDRNQCEMLIAKFPSFFLASFHFAMAHGITGIHPPTPHRSLENAPCDYMMSKSGHFWEWNRLPLRITGINGDCSRHTRMWSRFTYTSSQEQLETDFGFSGSLDSAIVIHSYE